MTRYSIITADNGWIVEWWEENGGETWQHSKLFAVPDDMDTNQEDPQALVDLLYFIKEHCCRQYYSKHKTKNAMIRMEESDRE